MAQSGLGTALRLLGERETGTERLEQAIVAYRLALQERTREKVPRRWATTQDAMGTALRILGERDKRPELFCDALSAHLGAWITGGPAGYRYASEALTSARKDLKLLRHQGLKKPSCAGLPDDLWNQFAASEARR
jgi:hypothetical protein